MRDKGSFYMLEAAIAILIMVTTLAVVLRQPSKETGLEISNYKLKVYNALKVSEDVGDLRRYSINNDVDTIRDAIGSNVPIYLDFDVTLYNRTDNVTAYPSIDYDTVLTVSYFVSGYLGNYDPREIRVFIWGFD